MVLESVAVWLVTNVGGFLTKQILTSDFVQDLFKDYAKDFFKDRFNSVPQLFQKEPIQKAVAKVVKEFLQLVEQELKFRRVNDEGMKQYIKL